jgi:hypothetical protein
MYLLYDTVRDKEKYSSTCLVFHSLSELTSYTPTGIDYLFIGNLTGEKVNTPEFISKLVDFSKKVKRVIYARADKDSEPSIDMVVKSNDGWVFPMDVYLDSYEGMQYLATDTTAKKVLTTDVSNSIVSVIDTIKPALTKGQSTLLERSVNDLIVSNDEHNHALVTVATDAIDIITKSSQQLKTLKTDYTKAKDYVSSLSQVLQSSRSSGMATHKSIFTYPTVHYSTNPNQNFYYFKIADKAEFTLSMLLGFEEYLIKKGHAPKFLILDKDSPQANKIYNSLPSCYCVSSSSKDREIQKTAIRDRITVVFHPTNGVIEELLGIERYSDFIILDKTNNIQPQIEGIDPILWCADSKSWLSAYTDEEAFFGRASDRVVRLDTTYQSMGIEQRKSFYESQFNLYRQIEGIYA